MPALFPEEERSRQPSVFSVLRALIGEFREEKDSHLGLVGAFGYDLLFQFDPIVKQLPRTGHKDLHCFSATTSFSPIARRSRSTTTSTISRGRAFPRTVSRAMPRRLLRRPSEPPAPSFRPYAGRIHGRCGEGAGRNGARRLL